MSLRPKRKLRCVNLPLRLTWYSTLLLMVSALYEQQMVNASNVRLSQSQVPDTTNIETPPLVNE